MFESAELGHTIDEETYDAELPKLREALLEAQYELRESKRFSVLILIGGVDGAGKGETVNALNEWMDPRHIHSHAYGDPTDDDRGHPKMWRFWRDLPPKGSIGIYFGSWYTTPIVGRVAGEEKKSELEHAIDRIVRTERVLTDDGVLLLKFWFHLSKDAQKKRLRALEASARTRWRVTKDDWRRYKHYDEYRAVSEKVVRETSTAAAPWTIVEGVDERYRNLTVGTAILDALNRRLAEKTHVANTVTAPPSPPAHAKKSLIDALDLSVAIGKKAYENRLEKCQRALNKLSRHAKFASHSLVLAYEGADAAGKGGNIRRVTGALDARQYRVVPVAAPSEEERAQPYLWRFWRYMPRRGQVTIFDRSWYGRVLVERVEGFATEADWQRAYAEINDFEEQLAESGVILVKFWLQIGKDEQKARFDEREQTGHKRFKITADDWRNREKWDAYQLAAAEMLERTSTDVAPWTLVAANDKHHARIVALETIVARVEAALG